MTTLKKSYRQNIPLRLQNISSDEWKTSIVLQYNDRLKILLWKAPLLCTKVFQNIFHSWKSDLNQIISWFEILILR